MQVQLNADLYGRDALIPSYWYSSMTIDDCFAHWPMTDNTNWSERVCDAQDRGRHVRCYTPG